MNRLDLLERETYLGALSELLAGGAADGGHSHFTASHPGPVALYVEQGLFGTKFFGGTGTVQPQPKDGTPVPAIEMVTGDDIKMPAGDQLFYDGAIHTMRNDGDDTLVLLVAALFDPKAPRFLWHDMSMGTPAAG